jgi:hypothetical protein
MARFAVAMHWVLSACLLDSGRGAVFLKQQKSYRQTLHNFQNVQYYADFDIGGQIISGIFDTGSFELLVRSTRCDHCMHPTPPYNHEKSKSYHKNGTVTQHVFGSGPCRSMLGYETVSVGNLKAQNQAFWEIVEHRIEVLNTAKFAAIVGIGPNFAYGNSEKTLLMSYGVDEFSVCLQKPSGTPGYLTWGPTESEVKPSEFAVAKVRGKHHWVSTLSNVTFMKNKVDSQLGQGPCGTSPCAAIIDSGTSLIAAPGIALMQLSKQIPRIMEDCSNIHELPTLHFNIDGHDFELPPQAYVMRMTGAMMEANEIWDILFFKPKIRKLDMCMPAFMQMDMMSKAGPIWILGMPFFRYYHTTFDRKKEEMRFSVAGPDCQPKPFKSKHSQSLISFSARDNEPLDVEVDALVPPTLSGMIDFPYNNDGELDL